MIALPAAFVWRMCRPLRLAHPSIMRPADRPAEAAACRLPRGLTSAQPCLAEPDDVWNPRADPVNQIALGAILRKGIRNSKGLGTLLRSVSADGTKPCHANGSAPIPNPSRRSAGKAGTPARLILR